MTNFQLVLIAWGDKYGPSDINGIYYSILKHVQGLSRVTLLSDGPREGLSADITLGYLPDEFLEPRFMKSGCQTKLAMFQKGILQEDLPALYLDLDTVILGDVSRLLETCKRPDQIGLLQSALLPFGPIARLAYRLSKGRRYARGNSSAVVFHPAHCHFIAERFLALNHAHPNFSFRPLIADERFISWVAQENICAISNRLMVKFATEFMYRWPILGHLRSALPWVRARRNDLVAITLAGDAVKVDLLERLPEGALVQDGKGRKLLWTAAYLGPTWARLRAHFTSNRA